MNYPDLGKLQILQYPDPRLREHAAKVREMGKFLQELAARMGELMGESKGVGLAATQVGWPFKFVILNPTLEPGKVRAFINPVILARRGRILEEEGCLSVPGVFAKVRRAEKVTVRATLPDGEPAEMEAEGLIARAWQHELDHLEGGLFVDRLAPAARIVIAPQLRQMEEEFKNKQK